MKLLAPVLSILILLAAGSARAQSPQPDGARPGRPALLEIDDCGVRDPALTDDELRRRGAEHYLRGETLYLQGEYLRAVEELVASYCKIPYYFILKDIGQAFERNLDYERAIAYLERYVRDIPPDAKRATQCAVDPQEDREIIKRRIAVLKRLNAQILVQTVPDDAQITIETESRVETRGVPGKDIGVPANTYTLRVERPGYETVTRTITVQIGKPYTYFFELKPLTGTLSVQVTPADARIFLEDRLVGEGQYDAKLDAKKYLLTTEKAGYIRDRRIIEVLPNQVRRVPIQLTPTAQVGRRQLLVFSTVAGGTATGALLSAFDESSVSTIGSLAGSAAAFLGSYVWLDDVPLGTSNLTITSTLGSSIAGFFVSSLFTGNDRIRSPITGASALLGAGAGYYLGDRTKVRTGDAALINTGMTWGTTAGALFYASFAPDREVGAGLVLTGLGMGTIGGVLLTRYFDISRTHAVLIDVGGIVGILGGLALEGLVYPTSTAMGEELSDEQREHLANFALGGMAVGLIAAGVLTRNWDTPKFKLQPAIGTALGADGASTSTFGFSGTW